MADEITKLVDMVVPDVFNDYFIQETVRKNAFLNSGIAASDPAVKIGKGGMTVNIPFYERLSNGVEVLKDAEAMTIHKITTNKDVAAIHARGVTYAATDLSAFFSGSDPIKAVAEQLSDVWSEEYTKIILLTLKGIFGVEGMAESVNDQSANVLTGDMLAESLYLLGDNYKKITGLACHSRVLSKMKKLDLIETVQPSELEDSYDLYMNKRVIVDDDIVPDDTGAYPIYFFGKGAIAYNENPGLIELEGDRIKISGTNLLISRRAFTMHPRGVKWTGTPADGQTPSDAEIESAKNWELVESRKNVKIAKLIAKVA